MGFQRTAQGFAQLGFIGERALGRHDIRHQLFAGRTVLGDHHGFANVVLLTQARFDLAQFDAETTDLHLMIDTPEVIHHAIRTATGQVAAAIHAAARFAEWVRHKTLGSQCRPFQITPCHAFAAQVQLASYADGLQVELRVQHVAAAVAQQCADGRVDGTAWIATASLPQQRRDHGFSRAVTVEQVSRLECAPGQVVAGLGYRITAKAVHTHFGWVAVTLGMLSQLLQVNRREHRHGHIVAVHLCVGVFGQPQAVITDQHAGAVDQRVHPAFVGAVEGERHEVQFAVSRRCFIALAGGDDVRHQRTVGHRHALGHAGGAGGVDHVGQVIAVQLHVRRSVAVIGPVFGAINRQGVQALGNRQLLQRAAMGQQQLRTAVLHHVQQAVTRVFNVQRHIHATGFHHREERHQAFGTAWHGNRHAHFRADATGDQGVGQAIGLAVQLAIAQGLRVEFDRDRLGVFPGAIGYQFMHKTFGREACIYLVPQLKNVLLLIKVKQVQVRDGLLLIGNHRLQQVLPMPRHALDSRRFEQVGGIPQRSPEPVRTLLDIQVKVEMGGKPVPRQAFDAQLRQRLGFITGTTFGLVVEHHLEQRVETQATLGLQGFDQLLERQVLVRLGFQRALLDLGQ
ncbi:hypothetical protein [Pseudomonas sp. 22 E 5]|nr:hypothetical protein [Pseudomonas sp. 22 E 5]